MLLTPLEKPRSQAKHKNSYELWSKEVLRVPVSSRRGPTDLNALALRFRIINIVPFPQLKAHTVLMSLNPPEEPRHELSVTTNTSATLSTKPIQFHSTGLNQTELYEQFRRKYYIIQEFKPRLIELGFDLMLIWVLVDFYMPIY